MFADIDQPPKQETPDERMSAGGVREIISADTSRVLATRYGRRLRAVVLTGSLSRDEAALLNRLGKTRVLGDADILVIFNEGCCLPEDAEMVQVGQQIEDSISGQGVDCRIGLSPVYPRFLRQLEPHIFAYELRTAAKVIWGDSEVLSLVKPLKESQIPREDAWWMLCNRIIELLEVTYTVGGATGSVPFILQYRCAKLWADMATSFLVFVGAYAPTYRERQAKLSALAHSSTAECSVPFSLLHFSAVVTAATSWRLSGCTGQSPIFDWRSFTDTVQHAHALWRWELGQLAKSQTNATDIELWHQWTRDLEPRRRLRGWAFALRKRGWHRSWRQWPHWLKLARSASPRYWIYLVASELFFRLPVLLGEESPESQEHWQQLRGYLPETQPDRLECWRTLARDIVWNYNQFLVGTRA